jgi:hypothetical protein
VIRSDPPACRLGEGITIPHHKKNSLSQNVTQGLKIEQIFLEWPRQQKMGTRFGTWTRRMSWAGQVAHGETSYAYKIFIRKPE